MIILGAVRLLLHLVAMVWLGRYALHDDQDSVISTENAYKGMLIVTFYELFMTTTLILGLKHFNSVIGGSQVILICIIAAVFSFFGIMFSCWWTASFGRANKFNKSYVYMNE